MNTTHTVIDQLYREYHQPIFVYLMRLVGQRETAEDLCQETFVKALRAWEEHGPSASVRAWLYRIATNTAYDYLRRQRRVLITALNDEGTSELSTAPFEARHAHEPMWSALNQLPERYRLPLLLHLWAGYSLSDIAAALGSNVATIKTRVYRARAQFRQHYAA